jgi:hypothetical protein
MVAESLHILRRRAIRCFGHPGDIVKQSALRRAQIGLVELAFSDCLYGCFFGSLNTQEVGMRVQSIWTAVEPGYPTGDSFLGSARQVALGKMDGVAEADHFSQKVGPMAEALQDAGHVLAA